MNNVIANLREATQRQNGGNMVLSKRNTSGVKGVYWDKQKRRWVARVAVDGKYTYRGRFKSIEDAAAAYFTVAKKTWGEFAREARR